jgi:hypothetical protein
VVAEKRQNDAYQAVLSPFASSGRLGIYQPFMTSCRKPFASRRSRWVRVRSLDRIAAAPWELWSLWSISRDCASFSDGVGIVLSC